MDVCRSEKPPPLTGTSALPHQRRALLTSYANKEKTMAHPLLEIRNATKIYGGGFLRAKKVTVALQDFNLTIDEKPATITTIAGESGSGKTTLANLVLGLHQADRGPGHL